MATFKLSITDGPGGVVLVTEGDPDFEFDDNDNVVLDELTPAQAIGLAVLLEVSEQMGPFDWKTLIR